MFDNSKTGLLRLNKNIFPEIYMAEKVPMWYINYNVPMKIRNILQQIMIAIFFMALVACIATLAENRPTDISQTATELINGSSKVTDTTNQDWVIIPMQLAEKMGLGSWLGESGGFWTPSENDILFLEENIVAYLSQNATLFNYQEPVWERLGEYQRQFIGIHRDGSNIIYGNYFCNNMGKNWRQEFVSVLDGGNCYFQVEYNLERRMFTRLSVNGES